MPLICPTWRAEYFRERGLDRANHVDAVEEIALFARAVIVVLSVVMMFSPGVVTCRSFGRQVLDYLQAACR